MYSDKTNNTWMRNAAGIALLAFLTACNPAPSSTEQVAAPAPVVTAKALEQVAPEQVGMDSGRLDRLTTAMQGYVDDGLLSGVVTMASRGNKIVHYESVGYRDVEAQAPMTPDTIFRIYSMTKPVTGAALMILYEEGKFKLSDPVGKYIPELADLQVFAGVDDDGNMITEPADHPMTIRELMSHTGGLSYGIFAQSGVDTAYVEAGILDANDTNAEFVAKLGQIPLKHQPGSRWEYSVAVDVQGYLVEVLSGQTFDVFLQERIFGPLGMVDTSFYVAADKADRLARQYRPGNGGELTRTDRGAFLIKPKFFSGGGGLTSTAGDYMKFAQMHLNGGSLNGTRILSEEAVQIMRSNQLPDAVENIGQLYPGNVFGVYFAIVNDSESYNGAPVGTHWWWGIAGSWFWIDPVENVVFVGMIQNDDILYSLQVHAAMRELIYNPL